MWALGTRLFTHLENESLWLCSHLVSEDHSARAPAQNNNIAISVSEDNFFFETSVTNNSSLHNYPHPARVHSTETSTKKIRESFFYRALRGQGLW